MHYFGLVLVLGEVVVYLVHGLSKTHIIFLAIVLEYLSQQSVLSFYPIMRKCYGQGSKILLLRFFDFQAITLSIYNILFF